MANHLLHENSPYLLQHAYNPVDWYPWGAAALEKARSEEKPIFLSIGYAACHWCHVMAHESFEDPDIAAILNAHFVNIKVDREERPDLDSIYMQAVVALTGQGGWPMSVFLTPQGEPFYGGTYFPPQRRYQMPAFREVLTAIARLWQTDRPRVLDSARQISTHLLQNPAPPAAGSLNPAILPQAVDKLAQAYDWKWGGWGKAPKFPQPMTIEFLLRCATRGDQRAAQMAEHALRAMARGGMYDVVGGGFARYATDDRWLIPHFEKMLYDNAQLALVYLHAWQTSGDEQFRRVCEETLDFALRELTHPDGGFYSSLDADSEGEEGLFYLWSVEEIRAALEDAQDTEFFLAAYGVTAEGNFEGKTVLQRALDDAQLAERFSQPAEAIPGLLRGTHNRLLAARSPRPRPGCDDKVLTGWNAFLLAALAEAGRFLPRDDYLAAAQRNARFLLDNLEVDGKLLRSWRAGQAKHNAYLEDHAALILGLSAVYQADGDTGWLHAALRFTSELAAFADPSGGFFDTRSDHETLLLRPKDVQDNATPSGNALAATALLQMAAFSGRADWRQTAEAMLANQQELLARYPTAFAQWLCAADFAIGPVQEVALVGERQHAQTLAFEEILQAGYHPRRVIARAGPGPLPPGAPALLQDRALLNGLPTAYLCQNFTCRQPTNDPADFRRQLENTP